MGLWSISTVLLLVSLDKIKLASSCKQWEEYTDEQLHKIISTAVQNAEVFDASIEQLAVCPRIVEIWLKLIRFRCKPRKVICFPGERYRRLTGECNNLKFPLWGMADRAERRFLPPEYQDGVSIPRQLSVNGHPLPSARMVSNIVHRQDPCCPLRERDLSLYVMQWGQMIDHDIVDTAGLKGAGDSSIMCCNISRKILEKRPECFPIYIPKGDLHFENDCMNFVRNLPAKDDWCRFGYRNQVNQATSFLDASFLYGQSHEDSKSIRAFKRGMLRMTPSGLFPPPGSSDTRSCRLESQEHYCMKSGQFIVISYHIMTLCEVYIYFISHYDSVRFIFIAYHFMTVCEVYGNSFIRYGYIQFYYTLKYISFARNQIADTELDSGYSQIANT
ncbi:hypothetical protein ACJMK2_005041 [Sinanodonta woodiana]|uniref:Chorion peroxidase n=1 Tax=Sinanodonta woodiana TaxID=1069815 RepID=A0ABD3VQ48_SINWO